MPNKRITIFCGHYGSGKTNIAVNYALHLKETAPHVAIIDLDIVNPYFRTKDSEQLLTDRGVELISSPYAGGNLDIPALPASMMRPLAQPDTFCVLDVGGDDRGAVALGRFSEQILQTDDYEMLFVVNFYRPLTQTAEEALGVMREIETACGIRFSGVVNNSNLGTETTAADVRKTTEKTAKLCELSSLPLIMTTAEKSLCASLREDLPDVFALTLQPKLI